MAEKESEQQSSPAEGGKKKLSIKMIGMILGLMVAEAAAVASPHDDRGNVVKAYVVLADGYEGGEDLTEELQSYMKEETAPYKYPRRIEYVDELPTTSSGKIRRIELRKEEKQKFGE